MSAPISAEARGKVRILVHELEAQARRITAAAQALPARELRDVGAFRKASERAKDTLAQRMLPLQPVYRSRREIGWRFLRPATVLPGTNPPQPGILAMGILVGAAGRAAVSIEFFGLQFTVHSLHRLFDRGPTSVDAAEELLSSHNVLLRTGRIEGEAIFNLNDVTVPSIHGAFLVNPGVLPDGRPVATARTWVASGMTFADQASDIRKWRELLDQDEVP